MNTDRDAEQTQLEQEIVRFTAQLHDLDREREDTVNALSRAHARVNAIKAARARDDREQRDRDSVATLKARLRVRIADSPYSKPTAHAQRVLADLDQGNVYPDTAAVLRALSAALSGFNADVQGEAYRARQSAVANTLALLPTKPPQ